MRDYMTSDGKHTVEELMQFMMSGKHRFFFGKIRTNDDKYANPSILADQVIGMTLVRPNLTFYYDKESNDIFAVGKANQFLNACYELLHLDHHLSNCFLVPELNGKTLDEDSSDDENIDYVSSAKLQKLICTMQLYKTDDKDVIKYIKNNQLL